MLKDRSCSPLFPSKDEGSRICSWTSAYRLKVWVGCLNWVGAYSISNDLEHPSAGCVADGHDQSPAGCPTLHTCLDPWICTPSNARQGGSRNTRCSSCEHCWQGKAFACCSLLWGLVYKYESVELEPDCCDCKTHSWFPLLSFPGPGYLCAVWGWTKMSLKAVTWLQDRLDVFCVACLLV